MLATVAAVTPVAAATADAATYWEALAICSKEWAERPDKATNYGGAAWQAFRAECVLRNGYVKAAAKRRN